MAARLIALLGLLAFSLGAYTVAEMIFGGEGDRSEVAIVRDGEEVVTLASSRASRLASEAALPFPSERVASEGPARLVYQVDRGALREELSQVAGGGTISLPERAVASRIELPIVKQTYPNNCETAALSMLLAGAGVDQGQKALQRELPTDGALDPEVRPDGTLVWGDPQRGFVGRVEGGGTAGGYGVYEKPIMELASEWAEPADLSGESPDALYERLLAGDPVMVWIGLQDGPYETWISEAGREIEANFGEHTVVLAGIRGDRLLVNDPLDGQRKWWTKEEFELMWDRLGNRAISLD
jgi:uncharacterized protein YvpB